MTGYYSRSIESAGEAARFTDSRCYDDLELLVNDSDALFLTVPEEVEDIFEEENIDNNDNDEYVEVNKSSSNNKKNQNRRNINRRKRRISKNQQ